MFELITWLSKSLKGKWPQSSFYTVDHDTLLHRLQFTFGVHGKVLSWLSSYLSGRSQQIVINETLSAEFELHCGVPQGSCLGPLLFTLYSSKLFEIIKHHFPTVHCYADDTQVYISFCPNDNLMLRSCWKAALMTFVFGCCMIILNQMMKKLNFLLLVHRNSLIR